MSVRELVTEARAALASGDLGRAAQLFHQACEFDEHEQSPEPSVGLAEIAMRLGRRADAMQLLDYVLSRHPRDTGALVLRGQASSNDDEALHHFELALGIDAHLEQAWVGKAEVSERLCRWHLAFHAYTQAQALVPGRHHLTVPRARTALRLRKADVARRLLTTHLALLPNDIDAIVTLADVLVEQREPELASELLTNAIARLPASAALYAHRARLAWAQGQFQWAREAIRHALELTPNDPEVLLQAARMARCARDLLAAEKHALRAIALRPDDWRGHLQLGQTYEAQRLVDRAIAAFRSAAGCDPRAWRPKRHLAIALLETGRDAVEAKHVLDDALVLAPRDELPELQYAFARACWQLGDRRLAERTLRRLAAQGSEHGAVAEARRYLTRLDARLVARTPAAFDRDSTEPVGGPPLTP